MYLHRVGDKVPPISKGAEDEQRRQVEPVVRVVQFRAPLKNLSDCDAAPYLRFFLVRNEEAGGSNPLSSTISQKDPHVLDPSNDATLADPTQDCFVTQTPCTWKYSSIAQHRDAQTSKSKPIVGTVASSSRSRNGNRQLARPPSESG
jgi:hypothetical protein